MLTKSELRVLLNRPNVQSALLAIEMDGLDEKVTESIVQAIIVARNEWHHEQWPMGPEPSEEE